ncbi:CHAT domain-containing protein [Vacuolonema iberomarrocanum]|uniref:CHAT domain-containing protein n=1 Tax=Vacuolonema iberomarrocanum TaxID=3454632 RepID=UPI001A08C3CB|nr:CHAT domain-containing protein [filamentous cyanobacterium LEGE 07170]
MANKNIGWVLVLAVGSLVAVQSVRAQSIRPADDGTGTRVRVEGDRHRITGGQTSDDGSNLFHSFEEFGLTAEEIAVFRSGGDVENILGRITGGDASYIDGLLRVLGSDANLFLINPAGIVFGENARLDLGGSFTATTATGIGFENGWFNVVGTPDYADLVGDPTRYDFAVDQPGAIANYGNLSVENGSVTLLAGTIINTGELSATDGDLTLATVPGSSRVRLTQEGSLLSLEVNSDNMQQLVDDPLALPELLTGGNIAPSEQLAVEDNQVQLSGAAPVGTGDVAIAASQPLRAQNGVFTATENLTVFNTTLQSSEHLSLLAGDTVLLRDSAAAPLQLTAGDQLLVQGNQTVDIFALTHPDSGLASGGDMVLRSPNPVLGDAYYFSGGNFRVEQSEGLLGSLISPFDPVIRSQGDVSFDSYRGASLHVIAGGQVRVPGSIVITEADAATGLEERITLSDGSSILVDGLEQPTLDIRAGVADVNATNIDGAPRPPGLDLNPGEAPTNANITIGSVNILDDEGLIFLSTQYQPNTDLGGGTIRIQDAAGLTARGGDIIIDARSSVISQGGFTTSDFDDAGGDVLVLADGRIQLTSPAGEDVAIQTSGEEAAGDVQLISRNRTVQIGGDIRAIGRDGSGGNVRIEAGNRVLITGDIVTRASGDDDDDDDDDAGSADGGNIVVRSDGLLRTRRLDTSSTNGQGGSVDLFSNNGNIRTRAIATQGVLGGGIQLTAGFDIFLSTITTGTPDSTSAGNISILSNQGGVFGDDMVASSSQQGGIIEVSALFDDISFNNIVAEGDVGGALTIASDVGNVTLNNVNVSGTTGAGAITIRGGDIETQNLTANATDGLGGTIELNSLFNIVTGNVSFEGATGGDLEFRAGDVIDTGRISARGTTQNGGNVLLETQGDIEAESIDARGGTNGFGGDVEVTTTGLLRIFGSVEDDVIGVPASITTSSALGEGSIEINHGGFLANEPFVVGDAGENGTLEAITTGEDTVFPVEEFDSDFEQGNLSILTSDVDDFFFEDDFDDFEDEGDDEFDETEEDLEDEYDEEELEDFDELQLDAITLAAVSDEFYAELEGEFVGEFADYLDLTDPAVSSVDDARDTLASVAQATGIRPALLYINFVPTVFGAEDADNDQLELVLVTPGEDPVRKRVLGTTRSQVMEVADQFRQEVTNPIRTRTTSYLPYAQQLYDWMIAPLETELEAEEVENLSFVLGAGLRSLPIAALHDGEGFLVERYSVGLMPSLSLVDTRYRNIQDNEVLAMGAAEFPDQFPLPAVPFEVQEIANEIWEGEAFLNQEFTLANLLAQRRDTPFGIVHLATHGEFRSGELSNSYIQFWDQRLQLDQLRRMNLSNPPVNLLVLSACRMALGNTEAELGFAGLAVQAGVQTALASLWYVSDAGTLALMTEFYRSLEENPTKAEALRTAQLAMIRGEVELTEDSLVSRGVSAIALPADLLKGDTPNLSHPYYWSAFTLIGSPW